MKSNIALNGEPIVRSMEYVFPGKGFGQVRDQFMLGDHIFVAPMLKKGTGSRTVIIPPGKWTAYDGKVIRGPATVMIQVPIDQLPFFKANKE